jgi:hypothetical protein
MVYSISNEIFSDSSPETLELINKIWINSRGRHFLYIGNTREFTEILNSEWYKNLSPSSKENIDLFYTESVNKTRREIKLIISSNDSGKFSLKEATEILNKPLSIILENIQNDKYFIDALLRCFESESKEIVLHEKNGWLIFENGGGNNIPNVINGRKQRFENNKNDFPKNSSAYLRMFILLDSDKKYPSNDEIAGEKKNLLDIIKQNNIPYWVTKKREMENYMPDEAIAEISYNDNYISAYLKLKPEQKDFFDIENGFNDVNFDSLENEIRLLYSDIDKSDYNKIFRKSSLVMYREYPKRGNFKSMFPKIFEASKRVTRNTLSKRANSDELEKILQAIRELI